MILSDNVSLVCDRERPTLFNAVSSHIFSCSFLVSSGFMCFLSCCFLGCFPSIFCIFPFSCSSKSLSRTQAFACQRSSWSSCVSLSWVLLCFEFLGSSLVKWPRCLGVLTDVRQIGPTSVGTARQVCNVSFAVTTTRLEASLFHWNCRIEVSLGCCAESDGSKCIGLPMFKEQTHIKQWGSLPWCCCWPLTRPKKASLNHWLLCALVDVVRFSCRCFRIFSLPPNIHQSRQWCLRWIILLSLAVP